MTDGRETSAPDDNARRGELTALGYAGLLPFFAAAIGVWTEPSAGLAAPARALAIAYGAIITAYMAGIGAGGLILGRAPTREALLSGMIATLVAAAAAWPTLPFGILLPTSARAGMLIAALIYLLLRDRRAARAGGLPAWYPALRVRLTTGASLSLLAVGIQSII
ncbi:MAG: DUF3429 domain-containing protein [Pseudomonadota bacterium]